MKPANLLIDSLLFEGVDKSYVEKFLETFSQTMHLSEGEILCRQNDVGDSMYLLESGKLEILINNENFSGDLLDLLMVATIEAGAVIGEMCVFGQKTRSATIRAAADTKLLIIDGETFRALIQEQEVGALLISYNIARLLSQYLVKANTLIKKLSTEADRNQVKSELEFYRQRFIDESLFN